MTHHTRRVGASVLLTRKGKVLLHRRSNTGWADGMLAIPGGHLNEGETARQAAVREAMEELGLAISIERLNFLANALVRSNHEYIYQVFLVELKDSEKPANTEPEKCSELVWCDPKNLPSDVAAPFRLIIEQGYTANERYLEIGY